MTESRMFYFGPWDEPGHFLFSEDGGTTTRKDWDEQPWGDGIDGAIQPGCVFERGRWNSVAPQVEGVAVLHLKNGWTALSFWDRTIDTRPGSHSTYIAEGAFTFEQMVAMAKARFSGRWNRMTFQVRLAQE